MRLEWQFLDSAVGRRLFALFLVCAAVPVGAAFLIGAPLVTRIIDEADDERLRTVVRATGMGLLAELELAAAELTHCANASDSSPRHLDFCLVLSPAGQVERIGGGTPPELDVPTIADGRPRSLLIDPRPSHPDHALLVERLDGGGLLVGGLPLRRAWNAIVGDVAEDVALELVDAESGSLTEPIPQGHGETAWNVFLQARFDHPGWKVVANRTGDGSSERQALVALTGLSLLLCLSIAAIVSSIQIRRFTRPIAELRDAATRIAARDFGVRVSADEPNELGALGRTFNTMTAEVEQHVEMVEAFSRIDSEITSTLDSGRVVEISLSRLSALLERPLAMVTFADGGVHRLRDGKVATHSLDAAACRALERRLERGPASDAVDGWSERLIDARQTVSGFPIFAGKGLAGCFLVGDCDLDDPVRGPLVERFSQHVSVALTNAALVDELASTSRAGLQALARAIDAKSPWTMGHSERVRDWSLRLGRHLGVDDEQLAILDRGTLLHDVGKISVPLAVLDKPGRLTDEEYDLVKRHTVVGAEILQPFAALEEERKIVRHHHERWDGRGYPDALSGEAIPFLARVVSVADVFDSVISERPYRQAWHIDKAIRLIREESGRAFEPRIVEAFLEVIATRPDVEVERCSDTA